MEEREGASGHHWRHRAACRLRRCVAPAAGMEGKGREEAQEEEEEEDEEEMEEEEEEGGRGAPLAVVGVHHVGRMREEAEGEDRMGELCFFSKEKQKLRYIFGSLDSDVKPEQPKKRTRSKRSRSG